MTLRLSPFGNEEGRTTDEIPLALECRERRKNSRERDVRKIWKKALPLLRRFFLHLFLSSVDKKLGKIQFETHHQIRRNFHNFDFCTFMDNLIWFAISVCFAFPWRKTQKVLFSMKKATKGITEWHLAEEKVGWLSFSSQSWLHITYIFRSYGWKKISISQKIRTWNCITKIR